MQVIGLCRFSYPGTGGFQVEHDSLEARIAYLYAPERLETRFRSLETITLPGIRAQFDPDFTFLIVIGDSLPQIHRDRLAALVADIPQVVIQSHPPGPHRAVMQQAINSVRVPDGAPCLQFRLDDDDAVAVGYVHHLRQAAARVAGLLEDHRHLAIDFARGYIARPSARGLEAAPVIRPFWTPGLALMFRPDVHLSVMNFQHQALARRMPAVSFADEDMMLRGHNDHNDSRQGKRARTPPLVPLDADGELRFKMTYNIDADRVRQVFSAP